MSDRLRLAAQWLLLCTLCGCAAGHDMPDDALTDINCNADLLCVEVYSDTEVRLLLDNQTGKPLSFQLFLSPEIEHLNPQLLKLETPGTTELVRFKRPSHKWGFRYRVHYGHDIHSHDDDYLYRLPYAPGRAWLVTQSHTNVSTHHPGNRYALDFAMPVGTPVHAAREGRVVSTYSASSASSDSGRVTANHIWIQHADGTIGKYLHLDHNGVYVAEGETVQAGQLIGASGNTGFSSGAHLHFSVSSLGGDALYRTFNVTFLTGSGKRTLIGGRRYSNP